LLVGLLVAFGVLAAPVLVVMIAAVAVVAAKAEAALSLFNPSTTTTTTTTAIIRRRLFSCITAPLSPVSVKAKTSSSCFTVTVDRAGTNTARNSSATIQPLGGSSNEGGRVWSNTHHTTSTSTTTAATSTN
jgi:hypothetical protein